MSISSRITSIEENIGNAYDKLDDLGIDLTNVDKNIDNIAEMLDIVYQEYPKVTGQGTELTLDGTKVGKLGLDVKGNSTQETTQGYNIMNFDVEGQSSKVTVNDDGTVTINGTGGFSIKMKEITLEANQTYRQKIEIVSGSIADSSSSALLSFNTGIWLTTAGWTTYTPTQNETKAGVWLNANKTFNNCRIKIWGYKGTDEKSFEKATDGASPNPSYEQPIYSAGDNNLFNSNAPDIELNKYLKNDGTTATSSVSNVSGYIKVTPNAEYVLNVTGSDSNQRNVVFFDSSKTVLSTDTIRTYYSFLTFTVPQNASYLRFTYYKSATNVDLKPSIGTISEKIVNKNLADVTFFTNNYGLDGNGLPVVTNGRIATSNKINVRLFSQIKVSYSVTGGNAPKYIYSTFKKDGTRISRVAGNTSSTTVDTSQAEYMYICFYDDVSLNTSMFDYVQVEGGAEITTYTAHQEQTYTIPVQQPMRSIGTVRDEFIQVNGEWKERHNIGRVVLNGTQGTFSKPATNRFNIDNAITDYLKAYNKTNYVSNQYICYSQQGNNAGFDGLVTNVDYGLDLSSGTTSYTIRIKDTRYNDVDDFKTWLSTHNLEVIYELATPVDLPCTAEQINILENLPKSYNEQTNIYSLDVTPAYIEAKALKGE